MASKERRAIEEEKNIRLYGKKNPKMADVMARINEKHENNNEVWHPIYKTWVKNEGINPSMQKHPEFAK